MTISRTFLRSFLLLSLAVSREGSAKLLRASEETAAKRPGVEEFLADTSAREPADLAKRLAEKNGTDVETKESLSQQDEPVVTLMNMTGANTVVPFRAGMTVKDLKQAYWQEEGRKSWKVHGNKGDCRILFHDDKGECAVFQRGVENKLKDNTRVNPGEEYFSMAREPAGANRSDNLQLSEWSFRHWDRISTNVDGIFGYHVCNVAMRRGDWPGAEHPRPVLEDACEEFIEAEFKRHNLPVDPPGDGVRFVYVKWGPHYLGWSLGGEPSGFHVDRSVNWNAQGFMVYRTVGGGRLQHYIDFDSNRASNEKARRCNLMGLDFTPSTPATLFRYDTAKGTLTPSRSKFPHQAVKGGPWEVSVGGFWQEEYKIHHVEQEAERREEQNE